ncbi:class I SAM-dependent methyltransferase [Bacillus sp. Marseille-Q3570]|uniref:class I SAM-dependent methyltransferase n=1 Tax=Bacillus sp. Marseille-Q3570 TaxID=2963522 RepID=UPI0021B82EE9|nr:class I SAM-dependent methyltransferase [Bacillus sp. Marseille-Q3570]
MILSRVLPFAKELLEKVVESGGVAVDATVGNGHDTQFLAELVGENGLVYGFDIQDDAIEATQNRLRENKLDDRVRLFTESHAKVKECVDDKYHGSIQGAMFNLGYLPGSDKSVITKSDSTLAAIEGLMEILMPGGLIVLVVYYGHEGGQDEKDSLTAFLHNMDQTNAHVLQYQFLNQKNTPPFVVAIEKRS